MNALILIAEDEPQICEILDAYLTREGFRTVRAGDGRAALDLHLALKPDLILLDVTMPRLDGWEVLAEIRRRGDTPRHYDHCARPGYRSIAGTAHRG
ncbi:hypothetical protein BRDID11002_12630 [Bradyrhizobium diazoefficiens]